MQMDKERVISFFQELDLRREEARPMAQNLGSAIALDYHYNGNKLIWSDVHHESIMMLVLLATMLLLNK